MTRTVTHYRDAVTGEYVDEAYARANPATTVAETETLEDAADEDGDG